MRLPKLPPLYFYPLASALLLPATFFLSYTVSVVLCCAPSVPQPVVQSRRRPLPYDNYVVDPISC